MPEANDTSVISISVAPGICGDGDGSGERAAIWSDSTANAAAWYRSGTDQPPHVGAMAAVVAGRVSEDIILEDGPRAIGVAGGQRHITDIVAGGIR